MDLKTSDNPKVLAVQAENLAAKIKHYLITTMGKISEEANDEEFYRAFSFALREEIMINWLATSKTIQKNDAKILYYLSLEYLPGRILSNNITNIEAVPLVKEVMKLMSRDYLKILSHEFDPALGNGGLGRLASCFMDSLATHHYPAQGYGLRYQYGIFEQHFMNGEQIEAPDCWLLNEYPWEFRRDLRRQTVRFAGHTSSGTNHLGDEIQFLHDSEEVWALPYDVPIIGYSENQDFSVATLRLWSTKESPRNFQLQRYNAGRLGQASENTTLTDVLYPADYHETGKRIRLKQEFLLVSASLQDIIRKYLVNHKNFDEFADKVQIQINDTHPALVIPELIRILNKNYNLSWSRAKELAQSVTGYTNHTIMKEALEEWDEGMVDYLLPRQFHIIQRLNQEFCDALRKKYPEDEKRVRRMSIIEGGRVRMAPLAIVGSHKVNGVAKLHGKILKEEVFSDFNDFFPNRITAITNGVTQRRWLMHCNPALTSFINERIGRDWITNFEHIKNIAAFADDKNTLKEFLRIKSKNKERLISYLAQPAPSHEHSIESATALPPLHVDSLFDVQIKRFHEYKRQLLNVLHIIMLYEELKGNSSSDRIKRTFIFSGKAAAGYFVAKKIIHLIQSMAKKINSDPDVSPFLNVIFIENYNVSRAEVIIPASDLSEQISTAGMEASGTGNMKLTMNGSLTIGTDDGANIEMKEQVGAQWWPFSFGLSAEQVRQFTEEGSYRPEDICMQDEAIRKAVDTLRDDTWSQNKGDTDAFKAVYDSIMIGEGRAADPYFVLKDLREYYDTQLKVEELYKNPMEWAKTCIHNIAGMGYFSTDRSVQEYANKIWGIDPMPINKDILKKVREEYSEHDKCRIY